MHKRLFQEHHIFHTFEARVSSTLGKNKQMFYLHFYKVLDNNHQCPLRNSFQRNLTYTRKGKHSLHQHIFLRFDKDYYHTHCSFLHTKILYSLAGRYMRTHSPCQCMCYHDDKVNQHSRQCQFRRTFPQSQADNGNENPRQDLDKLPHFYTGHLDIHQCLSHR